MNRRRFIAGSTALLGASLGRTGPSLAQHAATKSLRIAVDTPRTLRRLPADFTGLGYEISSVAITGLFSDSNHANVRLVRALGGNGVIRIGGITSDSASFAANAAASASAKATVINGDNLRALGRFLDVTGWRLIWGLNLGSRDIQNAADEAVAVSTAVKDKLLAFEVGNEPDGFAGDVFNSHRPKSYSYDDYLAEYRAFKAAIRRKLPDAPFAGPDASWATDWVSRFAADEGRDLELLTRHYYRAGANNPYLDKLFEPNKSPDYEARRADDKIALLLRADPGMPAMVHQLSGAMSAANVPFRICEANSFYGGGQPGASDVFASALWALDFMWVMASGGAAGVNLQTGFNHLDFVSYYAPIGNDADGRVSVTPEYYGMLAFAQAGGGNLLALDYDTGGVNLTAYAVMGDRGQLALTLINKDQNADADVSITLDRTYRKASALRLDGRALDSRDDVTLGGAAVAADGRWRPTRIETLTMAGATCDIRMPTASAAVVTWTV
jgi:hypothetical protein